MDPLTGGAIALAIGAMIALGPPAISILTWLLYMTVESGVSQLEDHGIDEDDTTEDAPPTPEEMEQARVEAEKQRLLGEQHRHAVAEAANRARERAARRLEAAVEELTSNIQFTARRVYVGDTQTGERFLGMRHEESLHPAHGMEPRPIRNPSEIGMLLPSELAFDDDILDARIATGTAMVSSFISHVPVMEPVFTPQYEEKIRIVYVMLDVSPSMFQERYDGLWRPAVFRKVTHRLLDLAMAVDAPFYLRQFDMYVKRKLRHATNADEAMAIHKIIEAAPSGDGTDTTRAILKAIDDFSNWEYDEADIMIVTDGEDEGLDVPALRAALDGAGIRIHAIMLGIENETLRQLCDVYQIVDRDLKVYPAVRRP